MRGAGKYQIVGAAAGGFVLACVGLLVFRAANTYHPIPDKIRQEIKFTLFYPARGSVDKVDSSTIKYDANAAGLSYVVQLNGSKVTVSQQAAADAFTDPSVDVYPKLLDKLHQYDNVSTAVGNVALTHPQELKGAQAAVMNEKGTLLFARPLTGDMSPELWKRFFDSFIVLN